MAKQSKGLTQFYQDYVAWLDAGAHNDTYFRRDCGLCSTLTNWWMNQGFDSTENNLYEEMRQQFSDAGLDLSFPFNRGKSAAYHIEYAHHTLYANPLRQAWVRKHANG